MEKIAGFGGSIRCARVWLVRQHSFVLIDHEIFSMVKESCQCLAKEYAHILVNCLEDWACLGEVWLGKLMGWLGRKLNQYEKKKNNLLCFRRLSESRVLVCFAWRFTQKK